MDLGHELVGWRGDDAGAYHYPPGCGQGLTVASGRPPGPHPPALPFLSDLYLPPNYLSRDTHMKPKEELGTTDNSTIWRRRRKQLLAKCSFCPWHKNENASRRPKHGVRKRKNMHNGAR